MRKYIKGAKVLRPQGWNRRDADLWFQVDTDKFLSSIAEHSKDGKINLLIKRNRDGDYYIEVDQDFVFSS